MNLTVDKPAKTLTEKDAKELTKLWLREHKTQVAHWYFTQFWDYGEVPFWALVARIYGFAPLSFDGVYGFQVYQGGRVLLVGKMVGF